MHISRIGITGFRRTSSHAKEIAALLVVIIIQLDAVRITVAQSYPSTPPPASGGITEPQGLTLALAVDIALRTNPMVRATTSGSELAEAQLGEARSGRMPFLQFSETVTRSNNPVFVFGSLLEQGRFAEQNFALSSLNAPDAVNNFRTALTFRIPVFDQKQTTTRINQAELGASQAALQHDLVQQQIRFEVLRAYYALVVAEAKQAVADEAVLMAESDVKRVRDMYEAGMVVQSDLLSVEVQLAEFRQQQIQAQGDIITARAGLNTALGIAIDTPNKVTGQLLEKSFQVADQPELIRLALAKRPEIARARNDLASSKERVRGARGEFLPRIDFFGSVGASGQGLASGSSDYALGASVTFNIFDAGRSARINQARAAEALASAEQEQTANQIRFEVVRAYQQYVSARARVTVARQAVEQAKESLRIVQDRYREGLTTVTETLRAETAFVRSRLALLGARYDHYVGYAGILLATGTLNDVQPFAS